MLVTLCAYLLDNMSTVGIELQTNISCLKFQFRSDPYFPALDLSFLFLLTSTIRNQINALFFHSETNQVVWVLMSVILPPWIQWWNLGQVNSFKTARTYLAAANRYASNRQFLSSHQREEPFRLGLSSCISVWVNPFSSRALSKLTSMDFLAWFQPALCPVRLHSTTSPLFGHCCPLLTFPFFSVSKVFLRQLWTLQKLREKKWRAPFWPGRLYGCVCFWFIFPGQTLMHMQQETTTLMQGYHQMHASRHIQQFLLLRVNSILQQVALYPATITKSCSAHLTADGNTLLEIFSMQTSTAT